MSFYIYQLVEPLILPNTVISLSAISHKLSVINYQLSAIFTKKSHNERSRNKEISPLLKPLDYTQYK